MRAKRRLSILLLAALACALLASCGNPAGESGNGADESSVASSAAPSQEAPSSAPVPRELTANPALAAALAKIKEEPQQLSYGCDAADHSGGSLRLRTDDEFFRAIDGLLSRHPFEELTLTRQPPYSRYVGISYIVGGETQSADDWTLIFLEEHHDTPSSAPSATFLSLMKPGYPEPVFFSLDRGVFDELYALAIDRVFMPEPPKEEFIAPLQAMIEAYKNGSVKNNELEPRFDPYPEGEPFPVIQTADDFTVEAGNEMVSYRVIIPIGDGSKWKMVAGMVLMAPPLEAASQKPEWNIALVSFVPNN